MGTRNLIREAHRGRVAGAGRPGGAHHAPARLRLDPGVAPARPATRPGGLTPTETAARRRLLQERPADAYLDMEGALGRPG